MNYQWIFFDADETLFSFDAFAGLQRLFAQYQVNFTLSDYEEFQKVNKPLWVQYQNGEISAKQLQITRFSTWAEKLQQSAEQLNTEYLLAMADVCQPLNGVVETLTILKQRAELGIITNGFSALQQLRLEKNGLTDFFKFVTVSEQIGIAKPDIRIFQHSLNQMNIKDPKKVLMVGDTLESDILGGKNAGLDTCWLSYGRENPTMITPSYTINRFSDLLDVVK